ncbi:hypothetical protein, partial [Solimonas terrae]
MRASSAMPRAAGVTSNPAPSAAGCRRRLSVADSSRGGDSGLSISLIGGIVKTIFSVLLPCVLLSACATVNTMAVDKKTHDVDVSTKSIVLLSLDVSHLDSTYYVPRANVIRLQTPGAKEKADRQNFKIDSDGMTSTATGHNSYLLRLSLKPGRYEVMDVFGDTGRFPFHGFFSVPLLLDIDVPAKSVIYMGRIAAVLRPRQGNEFRAGSVVPLLDQAVTGVSNGTFDVAVSDASQTDIPMMRAMFPSLKTADIRTVMLPAFDRDKVQQWWEGDSKNTEAAPVVAGGTASEATVTAP